MVDKNNLEVVRMKKVLVIGSAVVDVVIHLPHLPEKILKRLQAKYPNADFVLTYGEKGAWYVGNGETVYCPAKKVKVIDTTAAGDTFTGYFLSARGRGYGVEESLKKATAAAGEAVTRKGAAVSIPCWKELEEK